MTCLFIEIYINCSQKICFFCERMNEHSRSGLIHHNSHTNKITERIIFRKIQLKNSTHKSNHLQNSNWELDFRSMFYQFKNNKYFENPSFLCMAHSISLMNLLVLLLLLPLLIFFYCHSSFCSILVFIYYCWLSTPFSSICKDHFHSAKWFANSLINSWRNNIWLFPFKFGQYWLHHMSCLFISTY